MRSLPSICKPTLQFDPPHNGVRNIKLPYDNFCVYGMLTTRNRTAIHVALNNIVTYHSCRICQQRNHSYSKEKIN